MSAVRDSWRALWMSRLLVWAAGVGTILAFGFGPVRGAFNPPGITRGFGRLGDLLAAPAARWDSAWYLVIAHYGYRPDLGVYTASRTAFFPALPDGHQGDLLARHAAGPRGRPALLRCARGGAVRDPQAHHSRAVRARGRRDGRAQSAARLAVMLTAFAPMAFFLSAVYSESLYLALSVGVFWSARNGRWLWVGLLGALAAATRSTGLVLLLPALVIYLYGPREDRAADIVRVRRGRAGCPATGCAATSSGSR